MFLNLLVSLCCVFQTVDTLDVATVSSQRNTAAVTVSPVRVASEVKLEKMGAIGLHEALNHFSGISVKDYGGVGGLKTVSVRNMGASHTSVLYDGIAVSDAQNGQIDISRFNLDDLAEVSMSIGMVDDVFCSARHLTSAGVLRIDSRMPSFRQAATEVNARMAAGSFGTYNPYVSLKQKLGRRSAAKLALNATYSDGNYPFELWNGRLVTRGRRLCSDVEIYGAEAGFYSDWDDKGRLKAKINLHHSERGLPGSVILYTQNAYERLWDRSLISNVMYDIGFGEAWELHADAGFSHSFNRHLDTDPVYPEPQDSRYAQNEYSVAVRGAFRPGKHWKVVLAEDAWVNTLASDIPECPFPVRLTSVAALSAQYDGKILNASASLVGTCLTESLEKGEAPDDRFRLSPMIGVSWNFHRNMRFRASFKDGFRLPTFNDLYYERVGNRNLRPETARQFNAGLTFSGTYGWGTADLAADAYYNMIKDKIVAVPTMFIWRMRNVGEVAMYGADITASLSWRTCRWLTMRLDGNYSLQYAVDVTDPDSKSYRHQIPYTPRHCGSAGLNFELQWVNVSYRMTASGKRYSMNQNIPSNEIKGYADHSVSINRSIRFGQRHDYELYVGAEVLNLSDVNYEVIRYYPMPGRSFRITLKFKY